jgi:membrane protein implicated in regulation of membrane protease activity
MSVQWLVNWWNLIFLLPLGMALLYLGLYTVSGITFGEAEADSDFDADGDIDHDFDADHDLDADSDADADADADADHDVEADHDVDGEHEASVHGGSSGSGAGALVAALNWVGVGRIPVSLVLMTLMLVWGATGIMTNMAMDQRGVEAAWISIPLALSLSLLITHYLALVMDKYFPLCDTSARRRHSLLGLVGEAIFPIDEKFGMVSVRDDQGDLYQMPCRAASAEDVVSKGSKVQLIAYNAKQGIFFVKRVSADQAAAL